MTATQFYPQLTFFMWYKKIWKKLTPKKYSSLLENLNFISWNVIGIKHIFIVKGFLIVAGQMCKCVTFSKITSDVSDLVSETTTSNSGKGGLYHLIGSKWQTPGILFPRGIMSLKLTTMATENLIKDLTPAIGSQGEVVLQFYYLHCACIIKLL